MDDAHVDVRESAGSARAGIVSLYPCEATALRRDVVVTGIGVLLPGAAGPGEFWEHLESGTSQLATIPDPADPDRTVIAGRVSRHAEDPLLSEVPGAHLEHYSREVRCYLASVLQARDRAGLANGEVSGDRVGIYDGSSRGAVEFWDGKIRNENGGVADGLYSRKDILNAINGQTVGIAAALFKTTGPALAVGGSCAAGLIATTHACRDIEDDRVDIAFATGHDFALTPALFAMYGEAKLLRRDAATKVQSGGEGSLAFSEGAVTVVLENRESALSRGAGILARVAGHGYCNEGKNPFTVDITGESQARLMNAVLEGAGVPTDEVHFVIGHGNGLTNCDRSERDYMRLLFGDRADEVRFVSTKPVYGHTLGGSGSVNLAAAAMMVRLRQPLPAYDWMDPQIDASAPVGAGRSGEVDRGIVFTCGMGGLMAACLLERDQGARS